VGQKAIADLNIQEDEIGMVIHLVKFGDDIVLDDPFIQRMTI